MRVVAGSVKGKRLKALEGLDTRPTIDRVKEAIFSSIHFYLPTKTVLDLFAGSGQMGIEALSRGAKLADFVDTNPKSVEIIRENLKLCGFEQIGQAHSRDFEAFLKSANRKYDIVFLDPPFGKNLQEKAILALQAYDVCSKEAILVCESEDKTPIADKIGNFVKTKSAKYGNIRIDYFGNGEMT